MLKSLSYLNIAFAIIYFFFYLMNSYSWPIAAVLVVILYNGLVLSNIEKELRFTAIHYVLGAVCVVFAGFLTLWLVNIIRSSIAHDYFQDSWVYISLSSLFIVCILLQYAVVIKKKSSSE